MNRHNDNIVICKFLFSHYMLDDILSNKGQKHTWTSELTKMSKKRIVQILMDSIVWKLHS